MCKHIRRYGKSLVNGSFGKETSRERERGSRRERDRERKKDYLLLRIHVIVGDTTLAFVREQNKY